MNRNRHFRSAHNLVSDINLTNLIDVIMVVFIIYILIAPLVEQGININLPEGSLHKIETKDNITITITKEGKIYMGDNKFTLDQLKEHLTYKIKKTPDIGIIIKGDSGTRYGTIIKVLDELNNAGITKVGMATEIK